jgi:hypothetical protein
MLGPNSKPEPSGDCLDELQNDNCDNDCPESGK